MPTYQYACTNPDCGNRFELVQAFTDPSLTECPVCGEAVRKVYGSVGVVFKGSGFYRTDSRAEKTAGKGKKPAESGAAAPVAKSPSSSDSGSGSSSAGSGSSSAGSGSSSTGSGSSSSSPGSGAPAKAAASA